MIALYNTFKARPEVISNAFKEIKGYLDKKLLLYTTVIHVMP